MGYLGFCHTGFLKKQTGENGTCQFSPGSFLVLVVLCLVYIFTNRAQVLVLFNR